MDERPLRLIDAINRIHAAAGIDAILQCLVEVARQSLSINRIAASVAAGRIDAADGGWDPRATVMRCVIGAEDRHLLIQVGRDTGARMAEDDLALLRRLADAASIAIGKLGNATRLSRTLDSAGDAVVVIDRNWRYRYVNDEAERLMRRKRDDLIGRDIWTMHEGTLGTVFQTETERAMRENMPVIFDAFYEPFKTWVHMRIFPSAEGLILFYYDVTAERMADQSLRDSETRFRLLAKATTEAVWDHDLATGTIWWSDGVERLFGYTAAEMAKSPDSWLQMMHPDDRDRVMTITRDAIACKRPFWTSQYRLLRKDGSLAFVTDRACLLFDEQHAAMRIVGGLSDDTERRRFEEELRQIQRLEAIDHLTGGLAHDFNNLLTVILGNSDMLMSELHGNPTLRTLAEISRLAAERGTDLTQRLLAFSRRQPLDPRATDIARLAREMEDLLHSALREDIALRIKARGDLWLAQTDRAQLEAALLNLCANARDAMPKGGRVTIEMENAALVNGQARSDIPPGEYVTIAVADTGTGMPPAIAARAFEPFFTTKAVGKGSGLGLASIYGFVKQSGGMTRLETEPGRGTTVKLYFPRALSPRPTDLRGK